MCSSYPLKAEDVETSMHEGEKSIRTGLLLCGRCKRWYPIINGIPRMLPDEFREDYSGFLEKLPRKIARRYIFGRRSFHARAKSKG